MIELLNQTIQWWHWVILGGILFIAELSLGTFVLFGLSVASVITGVADYLFGMSFLSSLGAWTILSSIFIFVWKRYFHDSEYSQSGQSDYGLETQGVVEVDIEPGSRGKVRLDDPLVGDRVWAASASKRIPRSTRIKIIEIKGQLLEVEPA